VRGDSRQGNWGNGGGVEVRYLLQILVPFLVPLVKILALLEACKQHSLV
jgi:hypothetical protein